MSGENQISEKPGAKTFSNYNNNNVNTTTATNINI